MPLSSSPIAAQPPPQRRQPSPTPYTRNPSPETDKQTLTDLCFALSIHLHLDEVEPMVHVLSRQRPGRQPPVCSVCSVCSLQSAESMEEEEEEEGCVPSVCRARVQRVQSTYRACAAYAARADGVCTPVVERAQSTYRACAAYATRADGVCTPVVERVQSVQRGCAARAPPAPQRARTTLRQGHRTSLEVPHQGMTQHTPRP